MTTHPGGFLRPGTGKIGRLALVILAALVLATPSGMTARDSIPAGGLDAGDPFVSLLSLVPQTIEGLVGPDDFFVYYSNLSAQLTSVGLKPPDSVDDERLSHWYAEVNKTMLPPGDPYMYLPYWRDDYGFDLLQADQALEAGVAPYNLSLYRGRFDEQAIIRALEQVGYQPIGTGEPTIWSVRDDHAIDMDAPTTYKLAHMNFGTILDDGTLAFASSLGIIESIVDVSHGNAPSFTERPEIAALVAEAPDNLASALLLDGVHLAGGDLIREIISGTPDPDEIATLAAEESESLMEMPPIRHVLLGVTTGWSAGRGNESTQAPDGVPAARNIAIAHMYRDADAQTAVPVIEQRLATQTPVSAPPFAEIYAEWTAEGIAGTPLVVIDLIPGESMTPRMIYELFFNRSLDFLSW